MKPIVSTLLLIFVGVALYAQQNMGVGTANPDPSSILDLQANDKGILVPRMTTADRNNISAPASGLLVYDTDVKTFFYFDGTVWTTFSGTPPGGIIMWSGAVNQIPTGWALCDGTNNTPDLRGRFVVGYSATDPDHNTANFVVSPDTGGAKQQAHTHGINHDHPGQNFTSGNNSGGATNQICPGCITGESAAKLTHQHTTNVNLNNYTGTSGAASNTENRPPYYTLAFIMKL